MPQAAVTEPKKRRVLAVDDEEEILKLYDSFLQYRGYEVIALNNASEALAYLATETADILLLDVNMPGINGLKLLEMIRADRRLEDMRIVMISARRDEETVKEAVKLGIDSFVVKPFKLKDLAERIAAELFTVAEDEIRAIFRNPLHPRPGVLRDPGLTDFDPLQWDPYLVQYKEQQLCILIPRGMRTTRFIKAPSADLEERVRVFFRHTTRWKKVFPLRQR